VNEQAKSLLSATTDQDADSTTISIIRNESTDKIAVPIM